MLSSSPAALAHCATLEDRHALDGATCHADRRREGIEHPCLKRGIVARSRELRRPLGVDQRARGLTGPQSGAALSAGMLADEPPAGRSTRARRHALQRHHDLPAALSREQESIVTGSVIFSPATRWRICPRGLLAAVRQLLRRPGGRELGLSRRAHTRCAAPRRGSEPARLLDPRSGVRGVRQDSLVSSANTRHQSHTPTRSEAGRPRRPPDSVRTSLRVRGSDSTDRDEHRECARHDQGQGHQNTHSDRRADRRHDVEHFSAFRWDRTCIGLWM
jgi:hypothetical protein